MSHLLMICPGGPVVRRLLPNRFSDTCIHRQSWEGFCVTQNFVKVPDTLLKIVKKRNGTATVFCLIVWSYQSYRFDILFSVWSLFFLKIADMQFCMFCHRFWSVSVGIFPIIGVIIRLDRVKLVHIVLYTWSFAYLFEKDQGWRAQKRMLINSWDLLFNSKNFALHCLTMLLLSGCNKSELHLVGK